MANRLGRIAAWLWSGWRGLAGLALFAALWRAASELYGDFILPDPMATARQVGMILRESSNHMAIVNTLSVSLQGFVAALVIGVGGGVIAGYSPVFRGVTRPVLTMALATPPVAWIVLAIIWFGSGQGSVMMAVVVALTPLFFINAAQGIVTRDSKLDDMAKAFGVPIHRRIATLGVRQAFQFLIPTMRVCLGSAFKVAVMAELLAGAGGIGRALARARDGLDMEATLAWIVIAISGVVVIERLLIQPLAVLLERWRASSL
ncbi:ABC transporter permease [Alphaproteobacteria bacterium]|nr:ABC transporter permease [Alphaproteobacteria bacterium]